MKIVVCGSMTASKEMVEAEKELVAMGHEVVLPRFTHKYASMELQQEMHSESVHNKTTHDLIRKYYDIIQDGDVVLVLNIERKDIPGYIGGNSFLEMGFAHILNKTIYLLNDIPDMIYTDELKAMQPIVINGDYSKII